MAEQYPRKLPAKQLAILFGVSEQRISQLKRKGKLNPDSANLYDVQEAKQLRGFQMSEHGVRVVAQTYGNGTGKIAPPKVTPMNADVVLSPEDREALGIEPNEQIAPSPNSHFVAASRITELREQKIKPRSSVSRRGPRENGASWSKERRCNRRSLRPERGSRRSFRTCLPRSLRSLRTPTRKPRSG